MVLEYSHNRNIISACSTLKHCFQITYTFDSSIKRPKNNTFLQKKCSSISATICAKCHKILLIPSQRTVRPQIMPMIIQNAHNSTFSNSGPLLIISSKKTLVHDQVSLPIYKKIKHIMKIRYKDCEVKVRWI